MSDPEGNSEFCFPESPDASRDKVKGNIRTREKTEQTGFPVCYISRLSLQQLKRITGANQNSQLGTSAQI